MNSAKYPLIAVLAVFSVVEVIVRMVLILVVICTVFGGIILLIILEDSSTDFSDLLYPSCYVLIDRVMKEDRPVKIRRSQARELEYLRLKNEQLERTNALEREQAAWIDRQLEKGSQ